MREGPDGTRGAADIDSAAVGPQKDLDPEPWDEASDPVLALYDFSPGTPTSNPRIQIPSGFANYDCESMFYVIIGEMGKIVNYSRAFNSGVRTARLTWGLNYATIGANVATQRFDIISAAMDFGMASIIFSSFQEYLDIYESTFAPVYVAAARQAQAEYFAWYSGGFVRPALLGSRSRHR